MSRLPSFWYYCKILWRVYVPERITKKYVLCALYGSFIGAVVCGVLGVATVPDQPIGIAASAFVGLVFGFPLFLSFAKDQGKEN